MSPSDVKIWLGIAAAIGGAAFGYGQLHSQVSQNTADIKLNRAYSDGVIMREVGVALLIHEHDIEDVEDDIRALNNRD